MTTAVQLTRMGTPPAFDIVEATVPGATNGSVTVRLLAAEVLPLDVQIAAGGLPSAAAVPLQPGMSAAGEVTGGAMSGATVFVDGGPMGMGVVAPGTFAGVFAAPGSACAPLPEGLDPLVAAAGATAAQTAHLVLFDSADLQPGERVLVVGAAGAVGRAAAQVAAAFGATVFTAARDPQSLADLPGTPMPLDDINSDIRADVIIDLLGGDTLTASISAGGVHCRHVVVGTAAGAETTLRLPLLLLREHRLLGFNAFAAPRDRAAAALRTALDDLATGRVRVPVRATYPLHEVVAAYGNVRGGGRTLLVPS